MANLKQIEKYLKSKKILYKVIDLGREVFTVKGVVETGVNEGEIVKTLVVRTQQNLRRSQQKVQFIALAIRGRDRVDFKKISKLFGPSTHSTSSVQASLKPSALRSSTVRLSPNRLRLDEVNCELAKPEEVLEVCKVPIGAVCPILLDIPVYFDKRIMSLSRINIGSGDLKCGLEMELADLLKAVGEYKIMDLTST